MRWPGPVLTDSGGYQIFSLPADRTITEEGARFKSYIDGRIHLLSPERSIEMQTAIGSDIMMVLDECIDSTADEATTRAAMERTHRWALRSLAARTNPEQALFAIVQGGVVAGAAARVGGVPAREHPFDGFAIGGLAVGDTRARARGHDRARRRAAAGAIGRATSWASARRPICLRAIGCGVDMFDCVHADAPGVAGHGVHVDGPRARHARAEPRSATSRSTPRAPARPADASAAPICTTS